VRFAPSPTGALHIGGARTALYNWLFARGRGGAFVLRIEDTDRERSLPEHVDQIRDSLTWLGLDWDEGPLSQAERGERHREEIARLLEQGDAYEHEGAVRLRVPDGGSTTVEDAIRGPIAFEHEHIDDFVIARSDGSPLYNFAVAVDDRDMAISHVIRGADHISNTPRQIMVLRALDAPLPVYAHVPLLHGPDGKKLSKRHGAASVQDLRESGYLPEAVGNYLALLGWAADASTTFFTSDELKERFSLEKVSRSPAIFDEKKLRWMNGRYLRDLAPHELTLRLERRHGRSGLRPAVDLAREKMQTLDEFWPLAGFLVERQPLDPQAYAKIMSDSGPARLERARAALAELDAFAPETVEEVLRGLVDELGVKPRDVFQPVRLAISGSSMSPGIFESVALLGRDETLARIDALLSEPPPR